MVDYNPKSWFSLIFKIHKYGTVRKLFPTMVVLAALTFGYCYLEIEVLNNKYKHTMAFHSLVGFVISLLNFRHITIWMFAVSQMILLFIEIDFSSQTWIHEVSHGW